MAAPGARVWRQTESWPRPSAWPAQVVWATPEMVLRPADGLRFDDGAAMVQAALLGLGLAQVPEVMAAEDIAAGRLVEVLASQRPPAMAVYAVMPGNRLVPARVRALLEALQAVEQAR